MSGPVWSHKVDGEELNDLVRYACVVPEIDNLPTFDPQYLPIQGGYPALNYMQPREGTYTFLITIADGTVNYQERKDLLVALFGRLDAYGERAALSYSFRVRGMATPKTLAPIYLSSLAFTDYKAGQAVAVCTAPVPVPA